MHSQKQTINFLDSAWTSRERVTDFNTEKIPKIIKNNQTAGNKSTLFSRGKKMESFFTEDSGLYITPREQKMTEKGAELDRHKRKWDSLSSRVVKRYQTFRPNENDILSQTLEDRYEKIQEDFRTGILSYFSPPKFWNTSIIGAILLGMFSMSMIYRYLGPGVSANDLSYNQVPQTELVQESNSGEVLGVEAEKSEEKEDIWNEETEKDFVNQVAEYLETREKKEVEKKVTEMVEGYPIEAMIPYIMEQDRTVIAFLIGIAKKESNWGKRIPVLNGQDCYNYWGYRGKRRLMGSGGHTCFNSRKDAVDTVAKRIKDLVEKYDRDTPAEMVVWKCGSNCAVTGGQAAANKWISDVDMYFRKLNSD